MSVLWLYLFWVPIVSAHGKSFIVKRDTSEPYVRLGSIASKVKPIIVNFHVTSDIQFRYAKTLVESHVKNPGATAQEVSFSAIIPNEAFISNFVMVINDKEYVAEVQEKDVAKETFDAAATEGKSAGLVTQDVRDSNLFTLKANVESESKIVFKLTYEELLERKLGWYQQVININPGQIVDDLKITVNIDESRPLAKLRVPELKESNDIDFVPDQDNKIATVDWKEGNATARIEFAPNRQQQEKYNEDGIAGQLLIKYDVERDDKDNEVQVIDGYFVHYFTPKNLKPLPKHVIFVLDVSGSMLGEKIIQLRDAMFTMLNDMTERDYFNIVTFGTSFNHWRVTQTKTENRNNFTSFKVGEKIDTNKYEPIQANDDNRKEAIKYSTSLRADGRTNINDGLLEGLKVAENATENKMLPTNVQSIMVFLSDGEPTEGIIDGQSIKDNVMKANHKLKVPIYSLGFGRDADFNLIKQISLEANAFSKHIYEGSDAAFQLEDFFAEIASPLLSNLEFKYESGFPRNGSFKAFGLKDTKRVPKSSLSQRRLKTFFKGGEFVVTGKLKKLKRTQDQCLLVQVSGTGENGTQYEKDIFTCLKPCLQMKSLEINETDINTVAEDPNLEICPSFCQSPLPPPPRSDAQNFLQSLHAFLHIKQLLKKASRYPENKANYHAKALTLAINNNFVTELTSLVVVRPNISPIISSIEEDGSIFPNFSSIEEDGSIFPNISSIEEDGSIFPNILSIEEDGSEAEYPDYILSNIIPTVVEFDEYAREPEIAYDGGSSICECPINCTGNITMFSKTYFRGNNITLEDDTSDFADFDDKVVSLRVEGNCCWNLFPDIGFQGKHVKFSNNEYSKGLYKSTSDLSTMFREASSAKQAREC